MGCLNQRPMDSMASQVIRVSQDRLVLLQEPQVLVLRECPRLLGQLHQGWDSTLPSSLVLISQVPILHNQTNPNGVPQTPIIIRVTGEVRYLMINYTFLLIDLSSGYYGQQAAAPGQQPTGDAMPGQSV